MEDHAVLLVQPQLKPQPARQVIGGGAAPERPLDQEQGRHPLTDDFRDARIEVGRRQAQVAGFTAKVTGTGWRLLFGGGKRLRPALALACGVAASPRRMTTGSPVSRTMMPRPPTAHPSPAGVSATSIPANM